MVNREKHESVPTQRNLDMDDSFEPSSFLDILERDWKPQRGVIPEPVSGREGIYRPWEHTPADLVDPRVVAHQRDVYSQGDSILKYHIPEHIDSRLADFIETIYMMREAERRTKNSKNFTRRERELEDIEDMRIREFVDKMIIGTSNAEEVLVAMIALGIVSTEVTKLMHLFGYRLEYIDDMREEVTQAIEHLGGVVYDSPEEEYEILTQDNLADPAAKLEFALSMKRRRHLGTIGDVQLYERSSFIVRIDPDSHFDQALADHLRRMDIEGMLPIIDGQPVWKTVIMEGTPFLEQVKSFLKYNDLVTIIPLSTTIYAHNPVAEATVEAREREHYEIQRALTHEALQGFFDIQSA